MKRNVWQQLERQSRFNAARGSDRSRSRKQTRSPSPFWHKNHQNSRKRRRSSSNGRSRSMKRRRFVGRSRSLSRSASDDGFDRRRARSKSPNKVHVKYVDDTIIDSQIFNRTQDTLQRELAERHLIALGVNPFEEGNEVVLMTEKLNPRRDIDWKRQRQELVPEKGKHLFNNLKRPRRADHLSFSGYPSARQLLKKQDRENRLQEDAQKNDPNTKEVKESDIQLIQASKVNEDKTDLFSSIFDS